MDTGKDGAKGASAADIIIVTAQVSHVQYATRICQLMEEASVKRGTGIAKRSPIYIQEKIQEGKAIIALAKDDLVGFCYIETWGHGRYVANSGLIVNPDYQKTGVARKIKRKAFELSRQKYPEAKLFGITTSLPVMRINSDLGYKPVTFSELTDDEAFWKGCTGCKNFDILQRNDRNMCLCTGMLYDPVKEQKLAAQRKIEEQKSIKKERWQAFGRFMKLRQIRVEKFLKLGAKMLSFF